MDILVSFVLPFASFLILIVNAYVLFPLISSPLRRRDREQKERKESDLPRISILLPAYREGKTLLRTVNNIKRMNYPNKKLELIIVTEINDPDTSRIAKRAASSAEQQGIVIKHVIVKDTPEPRGKPRALNQAFEHTTGEIVGVLDAEDAIDTELCRKVADAICVEGYDGVQGILDMANDYDGWLNVHFRSEYGYWYRLYLPELNASGYPFPFGGTTNFFRAETLRRIGGWDSYNLTEDFEIGMRFHVSGLLVKMLDAVTREESPTSFRAWLRQRTRWQRGKIQTMRKIARIKGCSIGRKTHMLMSCLVPHVGVINIIGIFLSSYIFVSRQSIPYEYTMLLFPNLLVIFVLAYLHGLGYLEATKDECMQRRLLIAFLAGATLPAYWVLHWIADLRAIKQEFVEKRIVWEKMEHRMRHMGVKGFFGISNLVNLLEKSGYSVSAGKKLRGTSGNDYLFDFVCKQAGSIIVIKGIEAEENVSETDVIELVTVMRETGVSGMLLVASPALSREAHDTAKKFGLEVIETENLNYGVTLPVPSFGKE